MVYLKFSEKNFYDQIPPIVKGIYKVYSLDDNGVPKPICRLLGTDQAGVLYIGCCPDRSLHERLADAIKAFSPAYKSKPHSGGRKYRSMPKVMDKFPFSSLAITFEITEEPRKRELELLEEYCQLFGEEPPLNSNK